MYIQAYVVIDLCIKRVVSYVISLALRILCRDFARDNIRCKYTILSRSYNAPVFYFDNNISFLDHVLNQLFLPNYSSISQASYRTVFSTICFQLFDKPLYEGRVLVP